MDIEAIADDDVWAVAGNQVTHFDGVSWKAQNVGCARRLFHLVIQDENNIWVTGKGALLRLTRN